MKLWLSKNSGISVREQIVAQITLGVVSGDLPAGERVPSTRELARRFAVHANTIGAAYKKLSENGLIEFRRGSGFYVAEKRTSSVAEIGLGTLAAEFFRAAEARGFSKSEIADYLRERLETKPPLKIVVVEQNADLRRILIEEISAATDLEVSAASFSQLKNVNKNAIVAALINEKPKVEALLPDAKNCVYLTPRSVAASMAGETRPEKNDLIAVVSAWKNFLQLAKTVLVAAQIDADQILVRSTKESNWRKGLQNAAMIICDALAAKEFSGDARARVFRLIADNSLNDIRERAGISDNR